MKVETPRVWQSPAPTLARIESVMETCAESHGRKLPTCASSTFIPTARM